MPGVHLKKPRIQLQPQRGSALAAAPRMQVRGRKRRHAGSSSEAEEELPELSACLSSCLNSYAELGDVDQVRSLLESNVPHSSDWLGFNALHLAARSGHLAVCAVLLRHGFCIDARNKVARTPLHLASVGGYCGVARLLLDCGADGECEDFLRNRPLHCACLANKPAIVELLLRAGVDASPVNKFGQTPLHIAQTMRHQACTSLLLFASLPSTTAAPPSTMAPLLDVASLLGEEDGLSLMGEFNLLPDLGGVVDGVSDSASVDGDDSGGVGRLDDAYGFQFQADGMDDAPCHDVQSEVIVEPTEVTVDTDAAFSSSAEADLVGSNQEPVVAVRAMAAATPVDLRLELEELADRAAGGQLCVGLPAGCGLDQVPDFLSDLGINLTASHGSSLLGWFLDSQGCVVNLRATHEAANSCLTMSAFKVDCQLLEQLQMCET